MLLPQITQKLKSKLAAEVQLIAMKKRAPGPHYEGRFLAKPLLYKSPFLGSERTIKLLREMVQ